FHIGANQGQNITVSIDKMDAEGIGLNKAVTVEVEEALYTKGTEESVSGLEGVSNVKVIKDADDAIAGVQAADGKYYVVNDVEVDEDGEIVAQDDATAIDADETAMFEKEIEGVSIADRASADASIQIINDALNVVSTQRSNLGAIQNRLEHTINNLGASSENLTAA